MASHGLNMMASINAILCKPHYNIHIFALLVWNNYYLSKVIYVRLGLANEFAAASLCTYKLNLLQYAKQRLYVLRTLCGIPELG